MMLVLLHWTKPSAGEVANIFWTLELQHRTREKGSAQSLAHVSEKKCLFRRKKLPCSTRTHNKCNSKGSMNRMENKMNKLQASTYTDDLHYTEYR